MHRDLRNGHCGCRITAGSYARMRGGLERRRMFVRIVAALVFLGLAAQAGAESPARPALIPLPTSVTWHEGAVSLTAGTRIEARGAAAPTAAFLSQSLGIMAGK